jgi:CheY-like chemotaxis protein/HPt (histidine-containing phosphotransfer) domain-containing protein
MKQDFLKGKKILIAEDDFVNQKLITHSMQSTGAEFTIAGNGAEAIEYLLEGKYDLILMDINMPEMDGFEATEYIRKTLKMQIPIIAMTGWSSKDDNNKFERIGMNGTLPKPFGLDALYKTLGDLLTNQASAATVPVAVSMAPIAQTAAPIVEAAAPVVAVHVSPVPAPATPITPQAETSSDMLTVDLTLLNDLSESDNEYKKTIINMFLETMPETIQQIEKEFALKNWDAFSKAAHYAKSSLSVINVEELRLLVGKMEVYAKKLENLDLLGGMVQEMKSKYAKVVLILEEEMRK